MRPGKFIHQLREAEITEAIRAAEQRTSGEIRVLVTRRKPKDALEAAKRAFVKLGMARTRLRNAVLIYVAPRAQQFAVLGDQAIHAKCGHQFWEQVAQKMAADFKAGRFTEGIVTAIQQVGELLAAHFPRTPDDKNELPDAIVKQ
ncbi:MAG: TPM domain-containing protein [Verrucomicrobiae bacterium]|nr:TPM domain-containing protein [Verrucomicrobiae bacterium]MCX7721547.1 TPM domain-containing protein [Verrucomicrobiae bacterium]